MSRKTPLQVALLAIPLVGLVGCQSLWRDVPTVHKPASKVQLDASWFTSSGLSPEQIDQLVQQRRDHISAVQAERNQAAASPDSHLVDVPRTDVANASVSAANAQDGALLLEFGSNE